MSDFPDDRQPCGCPVDYHMSDCPILVPSLWDDEPDYYDDSDFGVDDDGFDAGFEND